MRSSTLDNNYKMSREEMLTMALARSGGSDVTVEALNVTQNGTYTEAGKAYSPVTVNISGYELASASGNPITLTDASALPLVECKATITATQDLNGYDKPWAGGANVNIADITYESQIVADVTITVNRDTNGNFESIVLNGTCSASQIVNLGTIAVESGETYAICDFCEGTYGGTTRTQLYGTDIILLEIYANYASGYVATGTASASGNASIRIRLNNGTTYTNVTLKPMCVKGSTISSFSPYSNICPISGTSSVTLTHNDTTTTQALSNTCYGG